MHKSALNHSQAGFTLAEAAMVLAVLAVVIGAMVPSFLSIRVAEQARNTAQNLKTVMNTIAAFVQSSGCVPCPVPAERALSDWRGLVGAGRGDNQACGICGDAVGLVPFRSLGIPESFAKDAYGHWLTYAVDTELAGYVAVDPQTQLPVSGANGMCSVTFALASPLDIRLSDTAHQSNIAVLLLSHGANGYGAYRNQPTYNDDRLPIPSTIPLCSGIVGAERCNASISTNRNFVAKIAAQGNDPFDDVYLYLDRNALVSYLGSPPCTTGWP